MPRIGRRNRIGKVRLFCSGIMLVVCWLMVQGCSTKDPVRIGFSGELTGRNADLGVHGRNGAMLAVESLNQNGGINGRPIELLVRDDGGTPEGARTADTALIEAGVVAIVGHMTSGQSVAGLTVTEKAGKVMLSPTTSTSRLTGIDDHFLRIQPTITAAASGLARLVRSQYRIRQLAIIADEDNRAYSEAFQQAFRSAFDETGGQVTAAVGYSSSSQPDFDRMLLPIITPDMEGLLIIASSQDTAFIAQHARISGFSGQLFSSGWAQTEDLIHDGGQAVEDLIMVADYDTDSQQPAFQHFGKRYRERFGRPPIFAAAQAYEAVMVLAEALKQTRGDEAGLKQALLNIRDFNGLVGTITMDPYGDVIRTQFVVTVKNGAFQTVSAIGP